MLQDRHSPAALGAAPYFVRSYNQIARAPPLETKEGLCAGAWQFRPAMRFVHSRGDAMGRECVDESRVNSAVQAIGVSSQRMIRRRHQAVGQLLIMENGAAAARPAHDRAPCAWPVSFASPMALEITER